MSPTVNTKGWELIASQFLSTELVIVSLDVILEPNIELIWLLAADSISSFFNFKIAKLVVGVINFASWEQLMTDWKREDDDYVLHTNLGCQGLSFNDSIIQRSPWEAAMDFSLWGHLHNLNHSSTSSMPLHQWLSYSHHYWKTCATGCLTDFLSTFIWDIFFKNCFWQSFWRQLTIYESARDVCATIFTIQLWSALSCMSCLFIQYLGVGYFND